MTTYQLLTELRNLLGDTLTTPQFWTDAELMRHLSEAYDDAARRTEIIKDKTTPAIVSIPVTANTAEYTLHEKVLRVWRAMWYSEAEVDATYTGSEIITEPGDEMILAMLNSNTGHRIDLKNRKQLDMIYDLWEVETGNDPLYFLTEVEHEFVIVPTPTVNGLVLLYVSRLPRWPLATTFTGTDISFDAATHKILYTTAGLTALGYEPDMIVNVSGSTDNDGDYTVSTVADGYLVVTADLTTEAAGASITVSGCPQDLDDHYHYDLLKGALSRAYLKGTNNCFNLPLSEKWEIEFTKVFGLRKNASLERSDRTTPLEGGMFAKKYWM